VLYAAYGALGKLPGEHLGYPSREPPNRYGPRPSRRPGPGPRSRGPVPALDRPDRRRPVHPLQARVFELRHNLTADDAMYVALAETLGLPLLTDDRKLDDAPGHHAEIHHYPD